MSNSLITNFSENLATEETNRDKIDKKYFTLKKFKLNKFGL